VIDMAEKLILTSECEKCAHSTINETDKSKITIYCDVKDRTYVWGQYIACEYKEKK